MNLFNRQLFSIMCSTTAKLTSTFKGYVQVAQHRPRCALAACEQEHSNACAAQGRACATILDKNVKIFASLRLCVSNTILACGLLLAAHAEVKLPGDEQVLQQVTVNYLE